MSSSTHAVAPLVGEVEAGELLDHQSDSTETMMTSDDASAEWAYGSDFYLQDAYLSKLNKHHRLPSSGAAGGGGGGAEDDSRDVWNGTRSYCGVSRSPHVHEEGDGEHVRIYINPDMVYPAFFYRGKDFAPVRAVQLSSPQGDASNVHSTSTAEAQKDAQHDTSSSSATPVWMLASGADMDISVPVVSMSCELVQSAVKGSAALAELKHRMAREKANRDIMDVSRSDLAQLMRKDTLGRRVAPAPSSSASSDSLSNQHKERHNTRQTSELMTMGTHRDETGMHGEHGAEPHGALTAEEGDALRREVRLAKMRLNDSAHSVSKDESAVPAGRTSSEDTRRRDRHTDWKRNHHDHESEKAANVNDKTSMLCDKDDVHGGHRKIARREGLASAAHRTHDAVAVEEMDEHCGAQTARNIRAMQQELPIYQCQAELMRVIGENAVTILVGETGSGKTTQLVQYLYHRGYTRDDGDSCNNSDNGSEQESHDGGTHWRIGCTQPRRLAAVGVARRVSEEMQCRLGSTVGYAIHLDDCTSAATRIKFMTDGVLLREIVHDPLLRQYRVVILDEAHERSVDTDVLMGVLKRAVTQRPDLKLIVTSATMETSRFSAFFHNAPCFRIPGRTFEVRIVYAPTPVSDYVAEAVFRVCQLHLQMPLEAKHDVLVFMTGSDDVHGTCELVRRRLRELSPSHAQTLLLIPCLSEAMGSGGGAGDTDNSINHTALGETDANELPHTRRQASQAGEGSLALVNSVLSETPAGFRKCVVATNVAETSLTIDGVRYVIDAGFMKTNVYRPALGMNTLQRYPVSQAQAQQRSGRAGRTTAGQCFRLYTEEQFATQMLRSGVPEIQRSSVESVVLLLKSIGSPGGRLCRQAHDTLRAGGQCATTSTTTNTTTTTTTTTNNNSTIIDMTGLRHFDFMDPPPEANVRRSMWHLWMLNLIDDEGDITADGRRALDFPVAPALAKLLLDSAALGCSVEVSHIVALITADPKNLFELPKGKEELAQQTHSHFFAPDSDHLTLLRVLTQFVAHGQSRQWARDHFLHPTTLLRACAVHRQLAERMQRLRLPWLSCGLARLDVVRYCLARAFALQSAQRALNGSWSEYRPLLSHGVSCHLHPSSALCGRAVMPRWVIYHDLLFATKEYIVLVTAVEAEWLVEGTHGLLQLRRVGGGVKRVHHRVGEGRGGGGGGEAEKEETMMVRRRGSEREPETNRVTDLSSALHSWGGERSAPSPAVATTKKAVEAPKSGKKKFNFGLDRRRDNV